MKIMLSAGEVSGDLHGARLAAALQAQEPEVELIGFGGPEMAKQGVHLVADYTSYNVMGIWEVIKNLRRLLHLLNTLTDFMAQERPDLLVLIDYPDFNWRLAKRAKALGIPVFSYIPPSAWAWRKGRARDCAQLADEFVAIFPHELPVYEQAGARISFVGNPLVDTVQAEIPEAEARTYFGLAPTDHAVLLLPGSRRQEIELLLPAMLGAAKIMQSRRPETRFFLPVAEGIDRADLERRIAASGVAVTLTDKYRYALMGLADVALATSGTVVMEAALRGLPCVVLYRLSPLSYAIGRLLVHVPNFSLPNILLGEQFQPELLQAEVEPQRIAAEALRLYRGEPQHAYVTAKLQEACERLGPPGAAGRVATKILAAARRKYRNDEEPT